MCYLLLPTLRAFQFGQSDSLISLAVAAIWSPSVEVVRLTLSVRFIQNFTFIERKINTLTSLINTVTDKGKTAEKTTLVHHRK
jgi:hypothetical protein